MAFPKKFTIDYGRMGDVVGVGRALTASVSTDEVVRTEAARKRLADALATEDARERLAAAVNDPKPKRKRKSKPSKRAPVSTAMTTTGVPLSAVGAPEKPWAEIERRAAQDPSSWQSVARRAEHKRRRTTSRMTGRR